MKEPLKSIVEQRLGSLGIKQHEALGQHFLINDLALTTIQSRIIPGARVIEVGPGIGQITDVIAAKAGQVTAIELDTRYAPVLDRLATATPNLEIVYGDALTFPWEKNNPRRNGKEDELQVIASVPYHISEPLLRRLITLNMESAVLILGKKLIDEIGATNPDGPNFGTLTLLTQAFFESNTLQTLDRDDFMPPPRTKSGIIELTTKSGKPGSLSKRDHVFRALFSSQRKNPSVAAVLKDALVEFDSTSAYLQTGKKEMHRRSRRDTKLNLKDWAEDYSSRQRSTDDENNKKVSLFDGQTKLMEWVRGQGISETTLHKPFRLLDNTEIRRLAKILM